MGEEALLPKVDGQSAIAQRLGDIGLNPLLLASDRVVGEPPDCERPFCNSAVLLLFAMAAE